MNLNVNNATFPEGTVSFKLQYGRRTGASCSAISSWNDVGAAGSGEIWRGYDATPADGLELSTSTIKSSTDVLATYEEENPTAVNPNFADIDENVEFDWLIEHNGATQLSNYCFRMVESDGTVLPNYNSYPALRTTGFTPVIDNWQWFEDATSTTPENPLAAENVTPIDIANNNEIKLRVSAAEVEGASGENVKFRLQYSEYADFSDGGRYVVASSSCTATSTWCYTNGGGVDNATVEESVLSGVDACTGGSGIGCGTYNEYPTTASTHTHGSLDTVEYDFALIQKGARVNAVYYFRLYDVPNDAEIFASSTYPSVQIEGAALTFSLTGLDSGTLIDGETLDVDSSTTSIPYGSLTFGNDTVAGYRLNVNTNATEGYKVLMVFDQPLVNGYDLPILPITGTNASPVSWATGCSVDAASCFGYHVEDDILEGGSTRFGANDSWATVSTSTAEEVMYSSVPTEDTHDIVFKLRVNEEQASGDYEAGMTLISVPIF